MYAAASGISTGIFGVKNTKKRRKRTNLTLKESFYVPFMWTTCATCCLGVIFFTGGLVMIFIGYMAKDIPETFVSDPTLQGIFRRMCYIGAPLMALGAFTMILSCVVVCETREKVLDLEKSERLQVMKAGPNFYDLILKELRAKEEARRKGWYDVKIF